MRPGEALLFTANLFAFVALAFPLPTKLRLLRQSALAAIVVAAAQFRVEGPRWQLVPAYAFAGLVTLAALAALVARGHRRRRARTRTLAIATHALAVVVLLVSVALPLAFPVFRMPKPTGPYAIGTLTYDWVDATRPEAFTSDPRDRRELVVQIWYPAKRTASTPAPYVPDGRALTPLARLLRLPDFTFEHLSYVTTNSIPRAPIADDASQFPVLILLHGRAGYRQENTQQVEELVSHGYIVAAVDAPYAASGVVFSDGRRVSFDTRMLDRTFEDAMVPYLARDASTALDRLAVLNEGDLNGILTHHLDLERVGIFGLSLGGQVTAEACRADPRFRACLAMDVWMPASVVRSGLRQPTMMITRDAATMQREGWSQPDIDRTLSTMRSVFEGLTSDAYFVTIPGMYHVDFSDAPLFSPLGSAFGISGSIDAATAHRIIAAYELAFFGKHLKGELAPLLDVASRRFPGVIFESRGP